AARAFTLRPDETLTTDTLYERLFADSPVPLDEIRKHPNGHVFECEPVTVVAGDADGARLDVGNADMLAELGAFANDGDEDGDYPFRLVSRRLPDIVNSSWRPNPVTLRRWPYNPAFMHPDDLAALGLKSGDKIRIESARAGIDGVAEAAKDIRPGVVSMSHCWGGAEDGDGHGSNTGRLTANDIDYDPHTGIPRMSAIPVRIQAAATGRA
ncbi:MAG: molybdopterin dinucleotide binding domain-containing protein, partial [Pseudomonadota bacterium]